MKSKMRAQGTFKIVAKLAIVVLGSALALGAADKARPGEGPTAESAMAAEGALAQAFRTNDADTIAKLLDSGWAVITANGDVDEGPEIFPEAIKSGVRTLKTFDTSEPRVRLYGNVAIVTIKLDMAGEFRGKPFDVLERETDTWVWKDGGWKCVLTHESFIKH